MNLSLDIVQGVIWSVAMGLAMASYATSLIFRLPIGEPLFDRHPYCDHCETFLEPRDLCPVFSWILNRGRCRFCGATFTGQYAFAESLVMLEFGAAYLAFGFSEMYLLVSMLGVALIVHPMILVRYARAVPHMALGVLMLGLVARTLADGSLYPLFVSGAVAAVLLGGGRHYLDKALARRGRALPAWSRDALQYTGAVCVWLPLPLVLVCAALTMLFLALGAGPSATAPDGGNRLHVAWTATVGVALYAYALWAFG